ncbi:DUF971 domain-containing protein [Alienimonas chondri]|uniref:Gamma-butyrobetaine hydroxylase-like N-terminal domain-containing protein n=1 Tax=Alienimonas chondri TaxID=2681879 RepID=A0ABX1VCV1_9PLAN|nr:DUF971 domain-containing protein [Alienimonas chondri]NNJ25932.1 hypothetical protein [Alienimonas chondri]
MPVSTDPQTARSGPPTAIRVHGAARVLELEWPDLSARLPFRALRIACPCAACVSETTGRRLLDPATVPDTIAPQEVALAGNYALRVTWQGGHDTGLFTWPYLREIAAAANAA